MVGRICSTTRKYISVHALQAPCQACSSEYSLKAGLSLQRQCHSWSKGRQALDDRPAYRCRYILQQLRHCPWLEICKLNHTCCQQPGKQQHIEPCSCWQEMAFEASQKYKEGKFIIEKARLLKVGVVLLC